MKAAWEKDEQLVAGNALHRKGFRLGDVTLEFILSHAQEELDELREDPDSVRELADLLGILIHYAVAKGWPMHYVEATILAKFKERFRDAASPDA